MLIVANYDHIYDFLQTRRLILSNVLSDSNLCKLVRDFEQCSKLLQLAWTDSNLTYYTFDKPTSLPYLPSALLSNQ